MLTPIISASILSADFANLGHEINSVISAGADSIHFDVMDHHFVPNLSFGAPICQSLRKSGINAPIDVHLMVERTELYIEPFAKAGVEMITFHPETVNNPDHTIEMIHSHGIKAGLVFNPDKEVELTANQLQQIDMILLMSVFPGFSGQVFIPDVLTKIQYVRQLINAAGTHTYLGIDGGVKLDNIAEISQAGANFFVLGSGIFSSSNYIEHIQQLRQKIVTPNNDIND